MAQPPNPTPPTFPEPQASGSPEQAVQDGNPFEDTSIGTQNVPQFPAPSHQSASPSVDFSTQASPSQSPPAQNAALVGDPRVAGLRAMFPDYDEAILLSVLESADGNQDMAIDILLGMSDPEYKPEPAAPAQALTQEELDEQLARRLVLEQDEEQARLYEQRLNRAPPPGGQRRNSRPTEGVYQPPPPPPPQGPGAMSEIQETITKAAEVGKKTLGGIFTKVKAKIQEFEQGRPSTSQQPQWAGGYDPQQHSTQQTNYAQYHHGSAAPASRPQASYYDPNTSSPVISEQTISPPSRTPAPAVQGYDALPNFAAPTPQAPVPAPLVTSGPLVVPPPASSPTPIDGGKLGLLPKRPVSLVRDPPSGRQQPRRSLDSEDGLEYAENPFDDQKK